MSIDAFRWAKSWGELPALRKFVLIMIADHYNDEKHRAWPTMETIAHETGMSRRSVVRCVAELEEGGLIQVEPWVNVSNGKQMANRYCLPLYDQDSKRAAQLPVRAFAGFGVDGRMEYDRLDEPELWITPETDSVWG